MKRFGNELRRALSVLNHPGRVGPLKVQVESSSLLMAGLSKLLNSLGKRSHSKCSRRQNVFKAHDLLVARSVGHAVEDHAVENDQFTCPFLTDQGCGLISKDLTVPTACIKRIISENPELSQLETRRRVASRYLWTIVRLLGVRA